jgi:hypothetical protein
VPTPEETKKAGYSDISEWGEKDTGGAYADGTVVDIGGEKVDLSKLPDVIGGGGKPKPKKS